MAGKSFVEEFLDTSHGFIILIGFICFIGLLLFVLQVAIDHLETNHWLANFGDKAGNIVSLIVFLGVMIKMNEQTFDIRSFCLMNNKEYICQKNWTTLQYNPENINCSSIYDNASNATSNVMFHYDGYSGFIKIDFSSDTDLTRGNHCRIDIIFCISQT